MSYYVYDTPAAFADYTGDNGYTSNDFNSGYMSVTNTTNNSGGGPCLRFFGMGGTLWILMLL